MPEKFMFEDIHLQAWHLLQQTSNLVRKCENRLFSQYGLTKEQHAVLQAIRNIDEPVKLTDVARFIDRNTNSVSLIIDRMVKAGLVMRIRDLPDRRSVRLVIPNKVKKALEPVTAASWGLADEMLLPLSDEDKRTLIKLLEVLRDKAYDYLNPGEVAGGGKER